MEQTKLWKVGDLAQLTGLTVRTLHHWNELGLVSPLRTESGHRCYSGADVARLYQVIAPQTDRAGTRPDRVTVHERGAGAEDDPAVTPQRRRRRPTAPTGIARPVVRILDTLDHEDTDIDVQLLLKMIQKMTTFENQLTASNANGSPHGTRRSAKTGGRRHETSGLT
jgi:MerR family transcriptional regulator, thiopeptide resistance regulator